MQKTKKGLMMTMEDINSYLETESFIKGYKAGLNFIIDNDKELKEKYNLFIEFAFKNHGIISKESYLFNELKGYFEEEDDKKEEYLKERLDHIYNVYTVILKKDFFELLKDYRDILL